MVKDIFLPISLPFCYHKSFKTLPILNKIISEGKYHFCQPSTCTKYDQHRYEKTLRSEVKKH